jgi:antibiotic biosynthesis monooxygenase (ABM) superfamily enzyme
MVTYIVHLAVRYEAHDEYVQWLRNEHINEVLKTPGFLKAELLLKKGGSMESSSREVKVIYTVADEDAIKTYFTEYAMPLREIGLEKFSGMFSAQREVWLETENFTVK